MGGSWCPGDELPSSASEAIATRGLDIPGVQNNARLGIVVEATETIPVTTRTSVGGTAPEVMVPKKLREILKVIREGVEISR
jgi:hypothetical protein